MHLDKERVLPIIKAALKEDIGRGDITTGPVIDKFTSLDTVIIAKEDCVVCGLQIAEWAMAQIDYSVRFKPNCKDGDVVGKALELAYVEGRVNAILRAERTMLNFLSFLSGIATTTKAFVDIASPYGVKIMDTRKTYPLLRYLEKYAVSAGGGTNHRMGLYDQVLIKDNHLEIARRQNKTIAKVIEEARKKNQKGTVVEVEVATIEEFNAALSAKPDIIMLDNMSPEDVRACVEIRRIAKHKVLLEVSGGITLDTVEEYAKLSVDMISVGSLTNSVKAIDMSLEIV